MTAIGRLRARGSPLPDPVGPVNTVLPSIDLGGLTAPVVGVELTGDDGEWTGATGFTRRWTLNGVQVGTGSTYTPADADAANGIVDGLIYEVTATSAGGDTVAESLETSKVRRTYPTLATDIGALTKSGYGSVNYMSTEMGLLGTGATAATTVTTGTATSGTDSHWTKTALKTPKPSATGDSADLNAGPYVFPITCTFPDGASEVVTHTITITPDVYSWGSSDNIGVLIGSVGAGVYEVVRGSTFTSATSIYDQAPATMGTIRYADTTRPSIFNRFDLRALRNITFAGIKTNSAAGAHWLFRPGSVSGLRCQNIVLEGCSNTNTSGVGQAWFDARGAEDITVNDPVIQYMATGFKDFSASTDAINIVVNRPKMRYIYSDFAILGPSAGGWEFNDPILMSPMRFTGQSTHHDGIQAQNGGNDLVIRVNRMMFVQADGDAVLQGLFKGGAGQPQWLVDGFIYAGRMFNGVRMGAGNSSSFKRMTIWLMKSGPVNGTSSVIDTATQNPSFHAAGVIGEHLGTNTVQRTIAFGEISAEADVASAWSFSDNQAFGGSYTAPPDAAGWFDANPTTALDAIDYSRTDMDAIAEDVLAALSPTLNGSAKRGDGSYIGALNPDRSWATDAAYVP